MFPKTDFQVQDREIRQHLLKRFPYSLIYEVTQAEIVVIAVAHHKRSSDFWIGR